MLGILPHWSGKKKLTALYCTVEFIVSKQVITTVYNQIVQCLIRNGLFKLYVKELSYNTSKS